MAETLQSKTTTQLAEGVSVTSRTGDDGLTLTIRVPHADCILHWGFSRQLSGAWQRPPEDCWPQGTTSANGNAARTPFAGAERKEVTIHLDSSRTWRGLAFVLHSPKDNRWIKSGGKDFVVLLPRGNRRSPEEALSAWMGQDEAARQSYTLDSGDRLAAAVRETPEGVRLRLVCDAAAPLLLHWGMAGQFRHDWQAPAENYRPEGTVLVDDSRTPSLPSASTPCST